jgi:ketosteroid isomerase-like protein
MSVVSHTDDEVTTARRRLIDQFRSAWESADVEALMALMTEDAVFHASLGPEPGQTFRGAAEVEQGFRLYLSKASSSDSTTDTQDDLISADFAVTRWRTRTVGPDGHVTETASCDVFEFDGPLIRFKDTYRKVHAPT